jgi:hypothetical protein
MLKEWSGLEQLVGVKKPLQMKHPLSSHSCGGLGVNMSQCECRSGGKQGEHRGSVQLAEAPHDCK